MSVYKELFSTSSEIIQNSVPIHPNEATDYGYLLKSKDDSMIAQIKSLIEQYDATVNTQKYLTGATQTVTIQAIDEWSEEVKDMQVIFKLVTTPNYPDLYGYLTCTEKYS